MANTLKGERVIVKGVCRFWISLILLLLPGKLVWSANLGDITVRSGLDEPFSAELNLLDIRIDELNTIEARRALADEIEVPNVQRLFNNNDLSFETKVRDDGSAVILVSSETLIEEPLIRFLIALEQHEATAYYEYRIALTPSDSVYAGFARVFAPIRLKAIDPGSNTAIAAGDSYGPIKRAENLITIAKSIKISERHSIYQTLYEILVKNPHAFIIGNMNLLRAGVVLDIPTANDIGSVPRVLAMETYIRQVAEWHEYRLKFQAEPNNEINPQQPDPAVGLMETTVGELRNEIKRLRILLENSVAEQTRSAELKEEEAQFRKQLERDIKRLESSETSLLETLADIRRSRVAENIGLSESSDPASTEESTVNRGSATKVAEKSSDLSSEGERVSDLREKLSVVEEKLELQVFENDQLQRQIAVMIREGAETAELIRTKDKALTIAQQEAAVYGAALESLEVKLDDTSETMVTEDDIELGKTGVPTYSKNQNSLEAASAEPRISSKNSSRDSVPASAGSPLDDYGLLLIGIGVGLFASLVVVTINKRRAKAAYTLKKGDVSVGKGAKLGGSSSSSDTVDIDRKGTEEAPINVSTDQEEIELDSKLDLARAYIEMEDKAAAKKLLVEIEERGSPQQKAQARQFLNTLG